MSGNPFRLFFSTLAFQMPTLLVCAAGLAAAAVFLRRYPRPAALTLAGTAVVMLVTVAFSLPQTYLIETQNASGRSSMEIAGLLSVLGVAGACLRAAGLGLILLAVFAGRRPQPFPPDEQES